MQLIISIDKALNYHYGLMAIGWMAERSKAAVLKTVEVQASGGSNPSPSVLVSIGAVGFSRLDSIQPYPITTMWKGKLGAMAERSKALPC